MKLPIVRLSVNSPRQGLLAFPNQLLYWHQDLGDVAVCLCQCCSLITPCGILIFLFKHQHVLMVSPGAMILPSNHVLKEMEKMVESKLVIGKSLQIAPYSIRQNEKALLLDVLVLDPFL